MTDEDGHTVVPAASGTVAGSAPGASVQTLAGLMSGRSTFGGTKRRRTTSTGNSMSEAQEGKVTRGGTGGGTGVKRWDREEV